MFTLSENTVQCVNMYRTCWVNAFMTLPFARGICTYTFTSVYKAVLVKELEA